MKAPLSFALQTPPFSHPLGLWPFSTAIFLAHFLSFHLSLGFQKIMKEFYNMRFERKKKIKIQLSVW